jgi:uncharacterized membrane protein
MEKETARIEAFSDGVFAIAITLLVLELRLPEAADVRTDTELRRYLVAQWPSFAALLISFFSIFIMWVNHHKIFRQIYQRNTGVMFANGLILFLAAVISYATSMLARFFTTGAVHTAVACYTGLFVVVNLAFNLLWYLASRDRRLLRPGISGAQVRHLSRNYAVGVPVHLGAFGLSYIQPGIALLLCVALWIYWAITSGKVITTTRNNS